MVPYPIILSGNNIKIWSVNIWGRVGQSRPKKHTFFDDFELPKHHFFTKIEKPEKRRSKTTRENRPKIEVPKNVIFLVSNKLANISSLDRDTGVSVNVKRHLEKRKSA